MKILTQERKITLEELSDKNGKEGKPAYLVFQGKVYDVSNSSFWIEGEHMGMHQAGKDLTNEMEVAPHSEEMLKRAVLVGTLV